MLRIRKNSNAQAAQNYFRDGLAKDDYYAKDSGAAQVDGFWSGKTAERLGLEGPVQKADFFALTKNRTPEGDKLTPRDKADRRVGFDFTFTAPKSVSVLHALDLDPRVQVAFLDAVAFAMQRIEADAAARVRTGAQNTDRTTGNLVWATFLHQTTRPVADAVSTHPDPHLHAHCFTFNVTFDPVEQRFKALQPGSIWNDAYFYQALYHARFAERLRALGYQVERKGQSFELSGLPKELIARFARSQTRNLQHAAEREARTDKFKDQLKDQLRQRKNNAVTWPQLKADWNARLTTKERRALEALRDRRPDRDVLPPRQAVDYAKKHLFERDSVVDERRLLAEALLYGVGRTAPEPIEHALQQDTGLIRRMDNGRARLTTPQVAAHERHVIAFAQEGCGQYARLGAPDYQPDPALSAEQRSAVAALLASRDRVMLLEGRAGVGKTTLLKEVVAGIAAEGKQVHVFAPSAAASRGVLRQDGFAEADTVANLLNDPARQQRLDGQVMLIDEAGLVSVPQMGEVFDLAARCRARVILSGDDRQHRAVERGRVLELLKERAGVQAVEVTQIRRQSGDYREAVQAAGRGDLSQAFETLDRLDWIREVPNRRARHQALVRDYLDAQKRKESVLIVSPTHAEAEAVTQDLRDALRENGLLKGPERPFPVLRDTQFTEAQRSDPQSYEPGMAVVFHRKTAGGFEAKQVWNVTEVKEHVRLQRDSGETALLPLQRAKQFGVYRPEELPLSIGDRLHITANGQTRDGERKLFNGNLERVKAFTPSGDIRLEDGGVLPKAYGHFRHGYVVTSHASQGRTVDRVLIAQASASFPASDRAQFYVSLSRARRQAVLYTDDRNELLAAVSRERPAPAALDLIERKIPAAKIDRFQTALEKEKAAAPPQPAAEPAPLSDLFAWKERQSPPESNPPNPLDELKRRLRSVDKNAFDPEDERNRRGNEPER